MFKFGFKNKLFVKVFLYYLLHTYIHSLTLKSLVNCIKIVLVKRLKQFK